MAYYAFLNENNVVTEVIAGIDETELIEGLEPEKWYQEFRGKKCVRTSFNANIRKHFASVGYTYDESFDAFIPPRPFPSWKLNYTTFRWEAPVARPEEVEGYWLTWSEINKEWIPVVIPQA